jgi:Ca2+-binding EF-hand superfamily protein
LFDKEKYPTDTFVTDIHLLCLKRQGTGNKHTKTTDTDRMTYLQYTVTETVHRRRGQIVEIIYQYEESRQGASENSMQIKKEMLSRHYTANITRDEYQRIANQLQSSRSVLPFDSFLRILRPFMMGSYANNEIHEAFCLLDRNLSNTVDLDEFLAFLPVIDPFITKETLMNHIAKVTNNRDRQMNIDEFHQLILRGIGRDIVCGHV